MAPLSDSVKRGTNISIARCRELLGEEANSMTDRDVAMIRHHAESMAYLLVEMYDKHSRSPE